MSNINLQLTEDELNHLEDILHVRKRAIDFMLGENIPEERKQKLRDEMTVCNKILTLNGE